MFVKTIIVLLLLIVLVSLVAGPRGATPARPRATARVRPLMVRVALVLLLLGAVLALVHLAG